MLGNRHSQHSFAQVPSLNVGRSSFDRSFTVKDAFDFDYLIPIYVDEVLPGDTFNLTLNSFARLATQVVPVMDNMYMDYFFFYVPNRLLWTNWEKFNGAQDDPDEVVNDLILPQLTIAANQPDVGTIYDKYGLPTDITPGYILKNTLPFRAYNRIWNEWFRDQNMQDSVIQNMDDGPDDPADYALLKRGKRHDYFTSALPWPQKGDAVELALGTSAPVWGSQSVLPSSATLVKAPVMAGWVDAATDGHLRGELAMNIPTGTSVPTNTTVTSGGLGWRDASFSGSGNTGSTIDTNAVFLDETLSKALVASAEAPWYADLSAATASTINELRQAIMVQSLLEMDARGGTRYTEILRAHFGVISPDFRLQRSEYLGGGSVPINVHPVPQTSPTSGSNAQGQLASFATSSTGKRENIGFTKSFVEHGYIIGLACARADLTYQQGLNRMFQRSTRYDFFWPKLQQLGEQAVLYGEIYLQGTGVGAAGETDDDVFGYQERYAEYRYKPSEIHGVLRSTYATSLDNWHLAEEFSALPKLNAGFIVQNTPIERAIAIDTEPDLIFDAYFKLRCARPMMTYSIPATLGRF